MPTQKTFKTRVRARMTKTGESYTTARLQLLRKADRTDDAEAPTALPEAPAAPAAQAPTYQTSDESMRAATGRAHDQWFALLDAWGGAGRRHAEIARWLGETHGVAGWWSQNITVDYERARGLRDVHQTSGGYGISVNRTIAVPADRLLAAFTDPDARARRLPDAPIRTRPTRAVNTARFDWDQPPSRLVVTVAPKGDDRATVNVTHERLPDADAAARFKEAWRTWLGTLKEALERP